MSKGLVTQSKHIFRLDLYRVQSILYFVGLLQGSSMLSQEFKIIMVLWNME